MPKLAPADFEIFALAGEHQALLAEFTCEDDDLDDFVRDDALRLQNEAAARTYLARHAETGATILGYVTLTSDAVRLENGERKKIGMRSSDHPAIPALKIARLGVTCTLQRTGAGTALVRFAFLTGLDVAELIGCRLLTLDAYPQSTEFYERLGFVRNRAKEYRERQNPSMRLDLFAEEPPGWL